MSLRRQWAVFNWLNAACLSTATGFLAVALTRPNTTLGALATVAVLVPIMLGYYHAEARADARFGRLDPWWPGELEEHT